YRDGSGEKRGQQEAGAEEDPALGRSVSEIGQEPVAGPAPLACARPFVPAIAPVQGIVAGIVAAHGPLLGPVKSVSVHLLQEPCQFRCLTGKPSFPRSSAETPSNAACGPVGYIADSWRQMLIFGA